MYEIQFLGKVNLGLSFGYIVLNEYFVNLKEVGLLEGEGYLLVCQELLKI